MLQKGNVYVLFIGRDTGIWNIDVTACLIAAYQRRFDIFTKVNDAFFGMFAYTKQWISF